MEPPDLAAFRKCAEEAYFKCEAGFLRRTIMIRCSLPAVFEAKDGSLSFLDDGRRCSILIDRSACMLLRSLAAPGSRPS